jgi:hypothetical protein
MACIHVTAYNAAKSIATELTRVSRMKAEHLIELIEERPFRPIRIYLSDGRTHDVRHPEMAIVSEDIVTIGLPPDESSIVADRMTHCATAHVVEAEPMIRR